MKRILLVEDDPHYRKVMEYVLIKEGYEVIGCTSGEEAFDQLGKSNFLLVITDYKMGKVTGLEVAAEAAAKYSIPVFLVTAHSDMVLPVVAGGTVNRIFNKPISLRILTDAVNAILIPDAAGGLKAGKQSSLLKGGLK